MSLFSFSLSFHSFYSMYICLHICVSVFSTFWKTLKTTWYKRICLRITEISSTPFISQTRYFQTPQTILLFLSSSRSQRLCFSLFAFFTLFFFYFFFFFQSLLATLPLHEHTQNLSAAIALVVRYPDGTCTNKGNNFVAETIKRKCWLPISVAGGAFTLLAPPVDWCTTLVKNLLKVLLMAG